MNAPFIRRLHKLTRQHGANQKQASKVLGLSEPTLSRYLSGERTAGTATVLKIARRSGCEPLWLITGKHSNPTPRCIKRLNKLMGYRA